MTSWPRPVEVVPSVTVTMRGGRVRTAIIERLSEREYIPCRKVIVEDITAPENDAEIIGHHVTVMPMGEFDQRHYVTVRTSDVLYREAA